MRRYAVLFAVVALTAAALVTTGLARDTHRAGHVVVAFLVLAVAALLMSGRWSRA